MSTEFQDNKENEKVLEEIRIDQSPKEVQTLIDKYLPDWIICSLDEYCQDYPHLRSNWRKVCDMSKTTPKTIVLVSEIVFDDKHVVTRKLCEFMTRNGYCVRRTSEYMACPICGHAIPNRELWVEFGKHKLTVPKVWSNKCSGCK